MVNEETKRHVGEYEPPTLGVGAAIAVATLFSGSIDPDAGTVEFGDGP